MIERVDGVFVSHRQMVDDYFKIVFMAFGGTEWTDEVITRGTGIQLRGDNFLDPANYHGADYSPEELQAIIAKYSFWNPHVPDYTKMVTEELSDYLAFNIHRVRYLRLAPGMGLSVHKDHDIRYHYPIHTNPQAFFATVDELDTLENMKYEHMPVDNCFYQVDTRKPHFVYNAGKTPRIHLVIS